MDTFESEVKALYQKGIEQEDYPEEKQQLEQARDERISQLKEKIEKLCFWGDVQDGDVRELEKMSHHALFQAILMYITFTQLPLWSR